MRWKVHGRRTAYESSWINVHLDDVELPDGRRFEHHVLSMPRPAVGTVVIDDRDRTLLIWRHRFITDRWGWEVPAGWADPGEDLADAARRETVEETGWTVDRLEPLVEYNPLAGISDWNYTVFLGTQPRQVGPVTDTSETTRVEWVPLDQVPRLAAGGEIPDGPSLLMLSYYLGIHRANR
jgi:8-oxo-dGTP pyrophosphatase MutT (NUDIX family)